MLHRSIRPTKLRHRTVKAPLHRLFTTEWNACRFHQPKVTFKRDTQKPNNHQQINGDALNHEKGIEFSYSFVQGVVTYSIG